MSPIMAQKMTQNMILAPRMIQSMEILQLPIMALQERIQQELQENPVLELRDSPTSSSPPRRAKSSTASRPPCGRHARPRRRRAGHRRVRLQRAGLRPPGGPEQGLGRPLQRRASPVAQRHGRGGRQEARRHAEHGVAAAIAAGLPERTARLFDVPRSRPRLVRYVIAHIDDNGFLTVPDEADAERRSAGRRRWKSWRPASTTA